MALGFGSRPCKSIEYVTTLLLRGLKGHPSKLIKDQSAQKTQQSDQASKLRLLRSDWDCQVADGTLEECIPLAGEQTNENSSPALEALTVLERTSSNFLLPLSLKSPLPEGRPCSALTF